MRRLTTLFALTLMLCGGLLVTASPAAAAPPQHYNIDACYDFGDGFVLCEQVQAVIIENTSASGNTTYVVNGQVCTQLYIDGDLVDSDCFRVHNNLLAQDGEYQVYHARQTGESTFEYQGTTYTCTFSSHVVFANGELRHEDYQQECNPPF